MQFSEAVGKLGSKSVIGSKMTSAEWADVPVQLRDRAFFSSQVESIRFLDRAKMPISDFLQANREMTPEGPALAMGSRAQFVDVLREFAQREGLGPLTPEDAGTIKDITSERRLALIFDTQTRQAGDYGYWRQGMDPDVLNEFPAQRFVRVQEVKQERDSHQRFEGQVYLKTDPIWANVINEDFGVPWGPWGWGCGHDVEDTDRAEAEQLGLVKPGEEIQPDQRSFNDDLEASTKGLEPDLLTKLLEEFGDQVELDEEKQVIRWMADRARMQGIRARLSEEVPLRPAHVWIRHDEAPSPKGELCP
jgi:hypothetical protein